MLRAGPRGACPPIGCATGLGAGARPLPRGARRSGHSRRRDPVLAGARGHGRGAAARPRGGAPDPAGRGAGRRADPRGGWRVPRPTAGRASCWWATRPITGASASGVSQASRCRRRPTRSGFWAMARGTACRAASRHGRTEPSPSSFQKIRNPTPALRSTGASEPLHDRRAHRLLARRACLVDHGAPLVEVHPPQKATSRARWRPAAWTAP